MASQVETKGLFSRRKKLCQRAAGEDPGGEGGGGRPSTLGLHPHSPEEKQQQGMRTCPHRFQEHKGGESARGAASGAGRRRWQSEG